MEAQAENERVTHLFTKNTISKNGREAVLEMGALLTGKAENFAYHYQLSPHPSDNVRIEDIPYMINTVLGYRNLQDQPQSWSAHWKNGRMHLHGAVSCFDFKTKKMRPNKKWARDHDKAREEIEVTLGWRRTRKKNPDHVIVAKDMEEAWHKTKTQREFMDWIAKKKYILAFGAGKFWAVLNSVGFDLATKIKGVGFATLNKRFDKDSLPKLEDALGKSREFKAEAKKQQFDYSPDERTETERERVAREIREKITKVKKPWKLSIS